MVKGSEFAICWQVSRYCWAVAEGGFQSAALKSAPAQARPNAKAATASSLRNWRSS